MGSFRNVEGEGMLNPFDEASEPVGRFTSGSMSRTDIGLKEALDELFQGLVFDEALAKKLYKFRVGYVTQNKEHMEFFGGNLLGVNIVRFKDSDRNKLCECLDVDYLTLVAAVRSADNIDHQRKVGGDPLNLVLMYLIYRFRTSKLSDKSKKAATTDVALIFFYRCAAILISASFKYPADPKVMQIAYSNLSRKNLIKTLGSWNKVMDYRANALLDSTSPHYKTLNVFDEEMIQYAVSDSQGRIKEMFKVYYSEFMKVHGEGISLGVKSSTVINQEGEESLREKTHTPETVVAMMRQIVQDHHTFILEDMLRVVYRNNSNTSARAIRATLEWISDQSRDLKHHKLIDEFLNLIVIQALHFMEYNIEPNRRRDMTYVLMTLKNLFLSTRSTDPDLLMIRELGQKIVEGAQGKQSASLMMATRTAVIVYICLRALAGRSNG